MNHPRAPKPGLQATIIRSPKVELYFRASNAVFEDEWLSWEAHGLMGYLLSKPDNWHARLRDLVRHGPAGEHKIRRMLKELERLGYLRPKRARRLDGTFTWSFIIFEDPALARRRIVVEPPV